MRALEIMGSLHRGGAETMIMNFYRAFDKRLGQFDFVIHAEYEEDYREDALSMGANIILLKRPGEVGATSYIKSLTEAIKDNGPYDAIHIHTNYQAFLGIIAAKRAGVDNIIVHSHSTRFQKKQIIVNRLFMRLHSVKKVACGEAAGKAFFGSMHYTVLNNAINVSKFQNVNIEKAILEKKRLFGDNKVIGHIGRFHKQKNHKFLIDMAQIFLKDHTNVVFALYGEGELQEEIEQIIISRGLSENIKIMGVTKDIMTAYKTFDVFILPSLYEGFPVTLVEAQLSAVPSITSDKVSRECDIGAGLLKYLPLEEQKWSESLEELLRDGLKKKEVSFDDFDVNIQWRRLYDIYKG